MKRGGTRDGVWGTRFNRADIGLFVTVGVLYGGAKPNAPSPPNLVNPVNPVQNNIPVRTALVQQTFAERKAANWNVRGAWRDSFWLDFAEGWVFPWGTNHLAGVFLATTWHTRRLKSNGTHEAWQLAAYGQHGASFVFTPTLGGIYQVRALASVAAGGMDERFYVWEADENPNTGLRRQGNPKAFGVCDEQWQIDVRDAAKWHIGAVDYLESAYLPASHGFSGVPWGRYKCNAFVAHITVEAGVGLPVMHGLVFSYPPLANELADTTVIISHWIPITALEFPQPGYVVAVHGTGNGHCGIVDFDGQGISAGQLNVNRKMSSCVNGTVIRRFER